MKINTGVWQRWKWYENCKQIYIDDTESKYISTKLFRLDSAHQTIWLEFKIRLLNQLNFNLLSISWIICLNQTLFLLLAHTQRKHKIQRIYEEKISHTNVLYCVQIHFTGIFEVLFRYELSSKCHCHCEICLFVPYHCYSVPKCIS